MIDIPDKHPSYILIVPVEYDLGRNTYAIRGNWMSDCGILTSSSVSNLNLTRRFTPINAETGEPIKSLLAFHESMPNDPRLEVTLHAMMQQNELVRMEIKKVVERFALNEMPKDEMMEDDLRQKIAEEFFNKFANTQGRPWGNILCMPKTQIFDGKPKYKVTQKEQSTHWYLEENSYNALFERVRDGITELFQSLGVNPDEVKVGYQH